LLASAQLRVTDKAYTGSALVACGYISVHLPRRPNIDAVHVAGRRFGFSQCLMVAKILVGMLCTHLLCFSLMFLLISQRCVPEKWAWISLPWGISCWAVPMCCSWWRAAGLERDERAQSHAHTGVSRGLLAGGHALFRAACALAASPAGLCRHLQHHASAGAMESVRLARYAMLSGMAALLFFGMVLTVIYGVRTFAKDLYGQMVFFAVLVSGICVLNVIKFFRC
jgi:hypothetical protein